MGNRKSEAHKLLHTEECTHISCSRRTFYTKTVGHVGVDVSLHDVLDMVRQVGRVHDVCDVHDLDVDDVCDVTGLTDMRFIPLNEKVVYVNNKTRC